MSRPNALCDPITIRNKTWTYHQYYLGNTDEERRRGGTGENHWSGAESLEWYDGQFVRDTMHGSGSFFWRHRGPGDVAATYEGHVYCNRLHGYGTMSYNDGRTFDGLFYDNVRYGPGVQVHACGREDIGLWRGTQLVRLSWRPDSLSLTPDFMNTTNGMSAMEPHRIKLIDKRQPILENDKTLELFKQYGVDSQCAIQKSLKLYPKYCTDLRSPLFNFTAFEKMYYKNKLILEEIDDFVQKDESEDMKNDKALEPILYYVWNSNKMIINMMKHSYTHEEQRKAFRINLETILSGPRKDITQPGKHEIDCRSLLMASYLGRTADVARLVNECNVNPNVCDSQGNTAIMYAVCGDQVEIIHFLKEAGADVNISNDSCCIPLGMALIRFVCAQREISPSNIIQAVLPQATSSLSTLLGPKPIEWNIVRNAFTISAHGTLAKVPSKTNRIYNTRKTSIRSKVEELPKGSLLSTMRDDNLFQDNKTYNEIYRTFTEKISETYVIPPGNIPVYVFEINDMVKEVETVEEESKKIPEKSPKKTISKNLNAIKTSKDIFFKENDKEVISIDEIELSKIMLLNKIKNTILQLLSDGANPRLVKCPQTGLLFAVISSCPQLVEQLLMHGADINEKPDNPFSYSSLDIAISRSYTRENLEVIRVLLESGANVLHRLAYTPDTSIIDSENKEPEGPNLLHAVLSRKIESDLEEEVRQQLLELLLEYNCNPIDKFKGQTPIDMAMSKNIELFNVFIKSPKVDLNCIINDSNQSVLAKLFTFSFFKSLSGVDRLETFTNLLLFGADPLIECYNGEEIYKNMFVYARKEQDSLETVQMKSNAQSAKVDTKAKKVEKTKKDEKLPTGKTTSEDIEDYKQTVVLVTDCARLIHIRWLQAKLIKGLIKTTNKFSHRPWNMIIKECKQKKCIGLWVPPQRSLEICEILSNAERKENYSSKILKHIICIVIYINWKYNDDNNTYRGQKMSGAVKSEIETDADNLLKQHKNNKILNTQNIGWKLSYVKPELDKNVKKFNICFECSLPLNDEDGIIECFFCKLVSFCSLQCIEVNVGRPNCHPCSERLKLKYFTNVDDDDQNINLI